MCGRCANRAEAVMDDIANRWMDVAVFFNVFDVLSVRVESVLCLDRELSFASLAFFDEEFQ